MRGFFAALTSSEIYEGCRTPSEHSKFSESLSEPTLSPSSSARESYEGLRSPDLSELSFRSADNERVVDVKLKGNSKYGFELAAQIFTLRELAAATKDFSADCLLRGRGYGRVYKGRLESSDQVVAIKQFGNGLVGNHIFLTVVALQSLLHHPNVVNLVGYCVDGDRMLVVHEYMPLGSLDYHLHDLPSGKKHLDWSTRMKIAAGVAKGLEFLHDKANPPVIYRNLKPSNILLGEDYHPKLSDFGCAMVGHVEEEAAVLGTIGYMAPEHAMFGELSIRSDIFSFGVVLLEIITGRKAIDISKDAVAPSLVAWARPLFEDQTRFEQMADPMLQGQYPKRGLCQALTVADMCLQEQPAERPAIADVVTALTNIANIASDDVEVLK